MKHPFRKGMHDSIPIALGYLSVSFTFGITAASKGIPALYAIIISMTNLTSAGQVAGIGIIAAGGTYIETALAQLVINLRYALMSLSLTQKLEGNFPLLHRFFISFGITDEIFAVASSRGGEITQTYMYGLILLPYFSWAAGTAIGALLGAVLPEIIVSSLGIAIYGMFIAIVIPEAKHSRGVAVVSLIAALMSCTVYFLMKFISSGISVIICSLAASCLGALIFGGPASAKGGVRDE